MDEHPLRGLSKTLDVGHEGAEAYKLIEDLYPICRSITGDGLRESLRLIQRVVPLQLHEVPTGTEVFDWTVPKEWNIRDAWIKNTKGERVVDFRRHNLHALNYSIPVRFRCKLSELRPHLHTLAEHPGWIPYRTSYYRDNWGFCLSQHQLDSMTDEDYDVCIDSSLESGHLTYGEYRIQGETDEEVLISSHSCHPSLANDNLSGMAIAARLARLLSSVRLRYSYRFLWAPATIGAIAWLSQHESILPRIRHGLVLSCLGDGGAFHYKRSRRGDAVIDRMVEHILSHSGREHEIMDFTPFGYDERQYGSPGIDLPVGCLMQTPNGRYPEYHTSADDLAFVRRDALGDSLFHIMQIVQGLEVNRCYMSLCSMGEPQLGRRGLYRQTGGTSGDRSEEYILWLLNQADGSTDLLTVAHRAGLAIDRLSDAAGLLCSHRLLAVSEDLR